MLIIYAAPLFAPVNKQSLETDLQGPHMVVEVQKSECHDKCKYGGIFEGDEASVAEIWTPTVSTIAKEFDLSTEITTYVKILTIQAEIMEEETKLQVSSSEFVTGFNDLNSELQVPTPQHLIIAQEANIDPNDSMQSGFASVTVQDELGPGTMCETCEEVFTIYEEWGYEDGIQTETPGVIAEIPIADLGTLLTVLRSQFDREIFEERSVFPDQPDATAITASITSLFSDTGVTIETLTTEPDLPTTKWTKLNDANTDTSWSPGGIDGNKGTGGGLE